MCLFLNAASFWVAGDMMVSEGETYLSEDLLVRAMLAKDCPGTAKAGGFMYNPGGELLYVISVLQSRL